MYSISIIILNYNTFRHTCECIKSILSSNKSIQNIEIIVVDNGSTENVPDQFDNLFPDIKLIKTGINLGFAKGNNIGIKYAKNDYILLLNSDVIIKVADTLYRCINKLSNLKGDFIFSPSLRSPNGDYQVAYGPLPSLIDEFIFTSLLYKVIPKSFRLKRLFDFKGRQEICFNQGYLVATCYLFERRLLKKLKDGSLFDKTFLYGEELFWAFHWRNLNVRFIYYPEEEVTHLVGQSSKSSIDYNAKLRKAYQVWAEYAFVRYRYSLLPTAIYYLLRIIRLFLFSWNSDMRIRFHLTIDLIMGKLKRKYPQVK